MEFKTTLNNEMNRKILKNQIRKKKITLKVVVFKSIKPKINNSKSFCVI